MRLEFGGCPRCQGAVQEIDEARYVVRTCIMCGWEHVDLPTISNILRGVRCSGCQIYTGRWPRGQGHVWCEGCRDDRALRERVYAGVRA